MPPFSIRVIEMALMALNYRPDVVDQIVSVLKTNSSELEDQRVTRVGPDWFGNSPGAHRIGVNTLMAHQAVEEEFRKLAASLEQYSSALTTWEREVRDADTMTNQQMMSRQQALEQVNTTIVNARNEAADDAMGDGRYADPSTAGSDS